MAQVIKRWNGKQEVLNSNSRIQRTWDYSVIYKMNRSKKKKKKNRLSWHKKGTNIKLHRVATKISGTDTSPK